MSDAPEPRRPEGYDLLSDAVLELLAEFLQELSASYHAQEDADGPARRHSMMLADLTQDVLYAQAREIGRLRAVLGALASSAAGVGVPSEQGVPSTISPGWAADHGS